VVRVEEGSHIDSTSHWNHRWRTGQTRSCGL